MRRGPFRRTMTDVLWLCGVSGVLLLLAGSAFAERPLALRPAEAPRFHLFPTLPATDRPFAVVDAGRKESLVWLPGDDDSVFTLGGPAPSGEPRLRFAVEVNEVVLKVLAPDPLVPTDDVRGRLGGDWKPIDATGRPYQLRLGARLIW